MGRVVEIFMWVQCSKVLCTNNSTQQVTRSAPPRHRILGDDVYLRQLYKLCCRRVWEATRQDPRRRGAGKRSIPQTRPALGSDPQRPIHSDGNACEQHETQTSARGGMARARPTLNLARNHAEHFSRGTAARANDKGASAPTRLAPTLSACSTGVRAARKA